MPTCPRLSLSCLFKTQHLRNKFLCFIWDSWRGGAFCSFKMGMYMRLCLVSEWKLRKLHFTIQNYFGANFTISLLPAGWIHATSFSSCCLQPQHHARKFGPSVHKSQPLPQFQLPAILAKEGLDLQLAGKFLPAISAALEPFGQKYGCFPRFCFVPVPHWLLIARRESCVASEAWLLCCCYFPSLHSMVQKGPSLPCCFCLLVHTVCYGGCHLQKRGFSVIIFSLFPGWP